MSGPPPEFHRSFPLALSPSALLRTCLSKGRKSPFQLHRRSRLRPGTCSECANRIVPYRRPRLITWSTPLRLLGTIILGVVIYASSQLLDTAIEPLTVPPPPRANWDEDLSARIDRVTALIAHLALPVPIPPPTEIAQGSGAMRWVQRRYDLTLPKPPDLEDLEARFDPLRAAEPGVVVHVTQDANGMEISVGLDGLRTHSLALHWLTRAPRLAVIIDDLGNDLLIARDLVSIAAPLTFAIMPFRPFSAAVAERATLAGREVLLHLPMEADSGKEFGAQGVLHVTAPHDEILRLVDESVAALPQAVGVNNHLGSRFTADRERMQWVLARLKENNLFFIDSKTSPDSVACDVAKTVAVPCATRQIFLDDADDEQRVRKQIAAAVELARRRGDVIAIGHARAATVAALRASLSEALRVGVDIVPASALVKR